MIFSNTTDPHPDSHHSHSDIFNTFSTVSLSCHMSLFLIHILHLHSGHNLPYVFHSTTLENDLLSSHPPPHPTECISTTVFIIFLHIEIASQSLHTHSHILLLDISLLYCFTLHTNYSACLASKYCWAVNIMLLKLIVSHHVRSLLVYVRVQLPEASTPPAFYDYITIRPRRPIS